MTMKFTDLHKKNTTEKLPKEEVFRLITAFLKEQTMCSLCTSGNDVPRATPLEYYADGTKLYIVGHQGVKLDNIKANPRVSVGIYNHVHPTWNDAGNWLGVKAAQVTGKARLIPDDNPEYFEARKGFASPTMRPANPNDKPMGRIMIVIEMEVVEYQDIGFRLKGYDQKQIWKANAD